MRTIQRDIVGGYIFSKDGKLLLGKNREGGVYEGLYLVPGGGIEEGELIESALEREMREETGNEIKNAKVTPFLTSFGANEKTLSESGERVLVKMSFTDYRIDLNQNANEVIIKTKSDWYKPHWFDIGELDSAALAEPTRNNLIAAGIIKS